MIKGTCARSPVSSSFLSTDIHARKNKYSLFHLIGVGFFGVTPTRLTMPNAIAFDARHNLYVVDSANNRVQRFDLLNNGC